MFQTVKKILKNMLCFVQELAAKFAAAPDDDRTNKSANE